MTDAELTPTRGAINESDLRKVSGSFLRIYLAPESRVMYMALNKNACTSLKWMMADLAGEDLESFRAGLSPFVDDEEAVHNRHLWKKSPGYMSLTAAARAEIHPDNGWFVFSVVRDPRPRFFSAWQNKILLQSPMSAQWQSESWFPKHPVTAEGITRDFAKFTEFMAANPGHKLRARDAHFRSQTELLAQHAVPYSHIYDISQLRQLLVDLTAHVNAQGREHDLYLPRSNSTALRANSTVYTRETLAAVEEMYADDLATFGDSWDPTTVLRDRDWTPSELAEVDIVAGLHRRITDLRDLAIQERTRAEVAERQIAELPRRRERAPKIRRVITKIRRQLGLR